MKKSLACLLACAALGLAIPQESHALTDAQHKQFLKASQEYRAADAKLNSVWRQLKGKLSAAEFASLLKDQRQWIGSRREVEAKGLIAQSIPEVDAYTAAILSRVNELTERLGATPAAKQEAKPAPKAAPAAPEKNPAAAKPAPEKPAAEKPAVAPAAPASQPKPVLTISKPAPAEPAAPAKAAEPAAKPAETAKPAADDKPARIEIGLPFLEEEKPEDKPAAPEAKSPAAQKPAPKAAEKPAVKPAPKPEAKQPAKAPQQQSNAAPNYKRATGTPEHPLAKGDNPACSGLQIVSSRYYGTNVAAPFVEMILRNDRLGNTRTVRVNGYEIKKIQKPHQEMPKWRPNTGNTVVLDVFAHTVLNEIGVEYADGSVCTIDKRSGEKDFTNPYIF